MLDRVQAAVALRALMGCTHGGEPISPEFHAFVVGILGNSSPSPSDVDMFNVTPPGDMETLREFAVLLRDIADAIWPRKKDRELSGLHTKGLHLVSTPDRPTLDDIEVTPEMRAAGAAEFLACRPMLTETAEDAAVDIFTAMVRASSARTRKDQLSQP